MHHHIHARMHAYAIFSPIVSSFFQSLFYRVLARWFVRNSHHDFIANNQSFVRLFVSTKNICNLHTTDGNIQIRFFSKNSNWKKLRFRLCVRIMVISPLFPPSNIHSNPNHLKMELFCKINYELHLRSLMTHLILQNIACHARFKHAISIFHIYFICTYLAFLFNWQMNTTK